MGEKKPRRRSITAGELLDRLEKDPVYIQRMQDQERQTAENRRRFREAEGPMLEDLARAGYSVESTEELRHSIKKGSDYRSAIPILLYWLPRVDYMSARESIVRALSVPWAKPTATPALIEEFKNAPPGSELGYQWAVGNALWVIADDSFFDEIVELAADRRYGRSREMLVLALGNMKHPKAVDVLLELLDDDEVAGHALAALRKLRPRRARAAIERFVNHPTTWWRNEAKKAIERIDKAGK